MGMIQVITGADFSGSGLQNIVAPLPTLSGKLFACYLPGTGWNGTDGALIDYSGQRGSLVQGSATLSEIGIGNHGTDPAKTPFTSTEIAAGAGAFSWVIVADVPTASASFALLNAGSSLPYSSLQLSTGSNAAQAFKVDSAGAANNAFVYNEALEGAPAFIHGRWDATKSIVGAVNPGSGWVGSAGYHTLATTKGFLNALAVRILPVADSVITSKALLIGFYSGLLTDDEMKQVYTAARKTMSLKSISI